MIHENLKIKTFDKQIIDMINASELPPSLLYYMFKGYTAELEKLFNSAVEADMQDLSSDERTENIQMEGTVEK